MIRAWSICLAFLFAGGCIFPIYIADEKPFSNDVLGQLEAGKTSKSQLRGTLGPPSRSFLSGRWWIYEKEHKTTEIVALTPSGGVAGGEIEHYRLFIRFDDGGLVSAFASTRSDEPCDSRYGVCYIDGSLVLPIMFVGDIQARPGTCEVVLFADGQFESTVLISADEGESRFPLVDPGGTYIYANLPFRSYEIVADFESSGVRVKKAVTINCSSQKTIYLGLDAGQDSAPSLSQVAEQIGQQRIRGRKVILFPDMGLPQ
jgi:hypothetical protein